MRRLRGILLADPAVILLTASFSLVSFFVSFFDNAGRIQSRLARTWAKAVLAASGVTVRVEGLDQIDPAGSYLFVSNHVSYMDTPVILAHIPVQFRFLAKRGLFQIPGLGSHLTRAGHIPVPREDPRAAVRSLQMAAETIQQKKISLLIFPEGGRSRDGLLRPFKEGGAYIAIRAAVQVVPIVLIGTREILPFGSGIVQSGPVTLRILKPISTSGLTLKARGPLTDQLRAIILDQLDETREPTSAATCLS